MTQVLSKSIPKFRLGQLIATPGAIAALQRSQQEPLEFIQRHRGGDWGEVDDGDKALNDEAIAHEGDSDRQSRVLSAYRTTAGDRIWIITEHDRSVTTVLLPEEY
jgi:hypothetical protein